MLYYSWPLNINCHCQYLHDSRSYFKPVILVIVNPVVACTDKWVKAFVLHREYKKNRRRLWDDKKQNGPPIFEKYFTLHLWWTIDIAIYSDWYLTIKLKVSINIRPAKKRKLLVTCSLIVDNYWITRATIVFIHWQIYN